MCGIAGFQGSFDRELLPRMTRAVAHRGPDGEGMSFVETPGAPVVGLGHRRLAIIDLSENARQPMTVAPDRGGQRQEGLSLIFNGEIYNYRELRKELASAGHAFHSESDSEVLLHLYEQHGFEMLSKLNGIFAFAIHDSRPGGRPEGVERGALFIARDQLGVKPLYFAETARGFIFASEIKALICDRDLARDIDPIALHQTLAYLWTPSPRTLLASVRKLEPGHALIAAHGRVTRNWIYFELSYSGARDHYSFDESAARLAAHLQTAVQRQLVSDVPVGAHLSGGLDSSAVVVMARRAEPGRKLPCFTMAFPETAEFDESSADLSYARKIAQKLDVELVEVAMDPNAIRRMPEMIARLDEPQADPAPINALVIAERARDMGIPVLLSGTGGDDLFSGYRRHWAIGFERRWRWLPQSLRHGLQFLLNRVATGDAYGQSNESLRRLAKMFAYAGETGDRRLISYFWWSTERLRRNLYSEQFAEQLSAVDTAAPLLQSLSHIPNEHDPLARMLYLETKHFLGDHNLNYTDRAGMSVGVEVRVPLLDLDLVEFATRVPSAYKQQGRVGKAVFKRAMEPYLPHDVIYRPKGSFGAPLRRWLRHELRDMVDDTLSPSAIRKRGFFDPSAVQRLITSDRAGRVDGTYTIFALMCVEFWCRSHVDH